MYKILTEAELKLIFEKYSKGNSITILGKEFGVSAQTIWRHVKKKGINRDMSVTMSKHSLNKNYFDIIDTEYKAYFLGLLFGDGSNDYGVKNNRITISMIEADALEVLSVFKKELNLSRDLIFTQQNRISKKGKPYKKMLTLTIYNKHMSKTLANLGLIKNKHNKMKFPTIPVQLYRHFVRGFFDADGSVRLNRNKVGSLRCDLTSNSKQLIEDIKEIVNLDCKLYVRNQKYLNYQLVYCRIAEARQFHNWMYNNSSIFLSRKKYI